MKRHPALIELSRDHQHGLATAHTLQQATETNRAAACSAFLVFWHDEAEAHFEIEDQVLLPALHDLDAADEAVKRVLAEHAEIRRRAADLSDAAKLALDDLHSLGGLLERHIRHEERVLFRLIERSLDDAQLTALGRALARVDRSGAGARDR
jgi:hemerythrin-like domain-containing protein